MTSCQNDVNRNAGSGDYFQDEVYGAYFGQSLPGDSAVLFAPGFISTPLYTRDISFMPDGREAYFSVSVQGLNLIFETKMDEKGKWSIPRPASFIGNYDYMYYEPFIDAKGENMYFLSNMPDVDSIKGDEDIWVTKRNGKYWSEPKNLGYPVNTDAAEFYPSLTKNGTLYFTRREKDNGNHYIYRSLQVNGVFSEPERLPKQVNCGSARFNAFISPDEDFIIVPVIGLNKNEGTDYYIVYNMGDNNWSEPIYAGNQMNSSAKAEYSASLSFDKKFIFFMSNRKNNFPKNINIKDLVLMNNEILNGNSNIYWMSTNFIEKLRPNE